MDAVGELLGADDVAAFEVKLSEGAGVFWEAFDYAFGNIHIVLSMAVY
jgi:hypothetical protein